MTVFHVMPQFHFVNERTIIGGYASAVARLAVAQAAEGSRVEIVSRMPDLSTERFAGVNLSNLLEDADANSHRHPIRFARQLFGFLRSRLSDEDSIHFHSGHAEYALVSAVVGVLLGRRMVHTLYCPIRPGARGLTQRLAVKMARFCGVSFSGMSRNVCKSIPGRAIWTPPVIDSEYFQPDANAPQDCQILFVGNATPSKGLVDLLLAFVNLVDGSEHFEGGFSFSEGTSLVVTTELARTSESKELSDVLNDLNGAGALSRISWLPIVPEMRELLGKAAVHVAPFRSTNGPSDYFMSTLEAMAIGKVCVVSDLPGMAEVIRDGENGFSFRSGDSADLRRALKRAIECDRSAVGERARNFVITTFGRSAVENTNRLYGDLNG